MDLRPDITMRHELIKTLQTLRLPPRRRRLRRWHVLLCHRRIPRFQRASHRGHICAAGGSSEDRGICEDFGGEGWFEEEVNNCSE
jgi:hypothetical protein